MQVSIVDLNLGIKGIRAIRTGRRERSMSVARKARKDTKTNTEDSILCEESICQKADRLVGGDRRWAYDHPWDNCSKIARIWSVILDVEVEPSQVALCMIGVKLAREVHRHKEDNLIDIAGYSQVAALAQEPPKSKNHVSEKENSPSKGPKSAN